MKPIKLVLMAFFALFVASCSSTDGNAVAPTDGVTDDSTIVIAKDSSYTLAKTAYDAKAYETAITLFDAYVDSNPQSVYVDDAMYWSAMASYNLNDVQSAQDGFINIITNYETSAKFDNALFYLGRIEDKSGNDSAALTYYDKFFATSPSDSSYLYRDALYFSSYIHYIDNEFTKSAAGFKEFTLKFVKSIKYSNALYYLARSYHRNDVIDKAETNYNIFLKSGSSDETMIADAIYYIGYIKYKNDDFTDAITKFNTIISDYPTTARLSDALYYVGKCYYNDTNYTKEVAIAAFNKVLTDSPEDTARLVDAYYYIGKSYYYSVNKDFDKSMENFNIIVNQYAHDTSRFEDATYWRGKVNYFKAINTIDSTLKYTLYEDAQSIFKQYTAMGTNDTNKNADAEYRTGVIDYYFGDFSNALVTFDNLLAKNYDYLKYENTVYYRGKTLYKLNRYSESETALQTLLSDYPQTILAIDITFYLALNSYKQTNYSDADTKFNKVLQSDDDKYDDAIYWMGLSKYKQADYTNAKLYFQRYISEFAQGTYVPSCESYITKCNTNLGI